MRARLMMSPVGTWRTRVVLLCWLPIAAFQSEFGLIEESICSRPGRTALSIPAVFMGSDWDRNDPALSASSDCDIYGALFLNVEGRGGDFFRIPSSSTTTCANAAFSEFSPSGVLAFSPTQLAAMPSNSARRRRIKPA